MKSKAPHSSSNVPFSLRIPGGRPFTPEGAKRLATYLELLEKWSGKMNLVASRDRKRILERHLMDSLQGWEEIERRCGPISTEGRWADVGSGGGFPGMAVALAWGVPFDLYEANGKKSAFLSVVRAETGTDWITVRNRRWEEGPLETLYDGATTRATFSSWSTFEAGSARLKEGAPVFLWRSGPWNEPEGMDFPQPAEQFSYRWRDEADHDLERWIWKIT